MMLVFMDLVTLSEILEEGSCYMQQTQGPADVSTAQQNPARLLFSKKVSFLQFL